MREIKFRGKDIESDVWFVGSYLEQYTKSSGWSVIGAHIARKVRVEGGIAVLTNEVDPETVGQFTGLKDKNGKEIYEGDIVATATDKKMVIGWSTKFASFVIERDGWAFRHWFGEAMDSDDCEVIGNRWGNPDLIK